MPKSLIRLLIVGLVLFPGNVCADLETLRLATTTSTENSGLLELLLPPFEEANNCRVDVIPVGTGRAIRLGESGDVDVILVHARSREEKFVASGAGVDRRDVMYNDFVILGSSNDPAGIREQADIVSVMKRIAAHHALFISRGDESGTHTREAKLWQIAKIEPRGEWYLEAGRGMGEVIKMADELQAYTLSDRGTFLAFQSTVGLQIVFSGGERLYNPYGAIMVNPQKHPHVNAKLAKKFLDYLVSEPVKSAITGFRKNGEQLFHIKNED